VRELPRGTVTFLFTDVEGSTRLLRDVGAEQYAVLLAEHHRLVREAFARHHGHELGAQGDALLAVFASAGAAVAAAVDAQRALVGHPWPERREVRVRMGLHSGEPLPTTEGYAGIDVHRGARIAATAHGGQIVLSAATHQLVLEGLPERVSLRDLGEHRLRDLGRPEQLFQVVTDGLTNEFPSLRTLASRPTNLPAQATPLIGRRRELRELAEILRGSGRRLLTLTGPGGTGKTRLALQSAADALEDFRDGVFFVGLEGLIDPRLVLGAIAQTLGVRQTEDAPLEETLQQYAEAEELLLVLDNFEQVVEAAPLVSGLLAGSERLCVLVTSREPLRLSGEVEYPVAPLTLVSSANGDPESSDAVALFVDRARDARPGFELVPENADAVAEICARLDGLPLAIELAAARTRVLTPSALLERLDPRLALLTGGSRDAPARHRTLRSTIEWSYRLLAAPEQRLYERLSVFVGGCMLDAVEAVCRPAEELGLEAVDGLDRLVLTSMARTTEQAGGEPRFTMLETLREYAHERLDERGESELIRGRHAEFFAGDPQHAERFWPPTATVDEFRRVNRETENIRAALDWAHEHQAPLELMLAVVYQRSDAVFPPEGCARLELALANPAPQTPQLRARALAAAGGLSRMRGDLEAARRYLDESLRLYREIGDERGQSVALGTLEIVATESGNDREARGLAEEYERLAERTTDPLTRSHALNRRAMRALDAGEGSRAREPLLQSLEVLKSAGVGGYWESDVLLLLAIQQLLDGDIASALAEAEAALAPLDALAADWVDKWDVVAVFAAALATIGELESGVRLYAAVTRQYERRGEESPRLLWRTRQRTRLAGQCARIAGFRGRSGSGAAAQPAGGDHPRVDDGSRVHAECARRGRGNYALARLRLRLALPAQTGAACRPFLSVKTFLVVDDTRRFARRHGCAGEPRIRVGRRRGGLTGRSMPRRTTGSGERGDANLLAARRRRAPGLYQDGAFRDRTVPTRRLHPRQRVAMAIELCLVTVAVLPCPLMRTTSVNRVPIRIERGRIHSNNSLSGSPAMNVSWSPFSHTSPD
jgi:predicted ATPase/class 3 adenylate cyclase